MTNANKRLQKGDRIVVTTGNYKGKTGEILSRKGDKVIVQGVNIRKKHMKRTQQGPGSIVEIEAPIDASNVMLCPEGDKPVKLKMKQESGQRDLVYFNQGKEVSYRTLKKSKSGAK